MLLKRSRAWFCALTIVVIQIRYWVLIQKGAWSEFAIFGFLNQAPVFLLVKIAGYAIFVNGSSGKRRGLIRRGNSHQLLRGLGPPDLLLFITLAYFRMFAPKPGGAGKRVS